MLPLFGDDVKYFHGTFMGLVVNHLSYKRMREKISMHRGDFTQE